MNTESNLHFQTAGLGPTALKLWKEMITLRDESFVVVIFAMVLLSSPTAELAGVNVSAMPWVA